VAPPRYPLGGAPGLKGDEGPARAGRTAVGAMRAFRAGRTPFEISQSPSLMYPFRGILHELVEIVKRYAGPGRAAWPRRLRSEKPEWLVVRSCVPGRRLAPSSGHTLLNSSFRRAVSWPGVPAGAAARRNVEVPVMVRPLGE